MYWLCKLKIIPASLVFCNKLCSFYSKIDAHRKRTQSAVGCFPCFRNYRNPINSGRLVHEKKHEYLDRTCEFFTSLALFIMLQLSSLNKKFTCTYKFLCNLRDESWSIYNVVHVLYSLHFRALNDTVSVTDLLWPLKPT